MRSLEFIYSAFGLTLLAVIIIYYYSSIRERKESSFSDSQIWLFGSIGYIIVLFTSGFGDGYNDNYFYIYLISSLLLTMYILTKNTQKQIVVPRRFYISLLIFNIFWILYSIDQGSSFFITVLPSVLLQAAAYFFVGLVYLLKEDYEMSMRNITGMLFLLMTLIKLFYLIDIPIEHSAQIMMIFKADFSNYIILCFVIILFDYNRNCMVSNRQNRQFAESFQHIPLGIMQINSRGDIISMNERVKNAMKVSEYVEYSDEIVNIHELSKLPFDEEWQRILAQLNDGKTYSLEADIFLKNDTTHYEFLFLPNLNESESENQSNIATCLVLDSRRATSLLKNVEREEKEELSIPNKYKLMELFDYGVHQKLMRNFGVILIKIVNYDAITNIVNSHETSAIDQLVISKMRKLDFVYCVGKVNQDTFEVITHDLLSMSEIHDYTQNMKDILSHQSFYDNEMNVYTLNYRIGISMAPNDGFTQRELLRKASIAIAKATTEEKGYVQFYNDHIKDEVATKLQIESKLREGIDNDELFLEYQPQYTIKDDKIRGFEALVRWKLHDGSIMSPDEFIPIAEELDLIDDLGEWVLRHSLIEASRWNNRYHKNWMICVNISVSQLENEGFAESVIKIIEEFNFPTHLLELEVTETKMAKSTDRVFIELKKLHDFGIKIAIDDFGTGYSSLDYLRLLPFDILKIDKGFIERLNTNETDHRIVESIIEPVNKLDLESLAEGVETKEQLEFLRKTSCNYVQGFVYSKSLSKDAVIDLLIESLDD
jgi:EAL domain-containing protein (putative c-di-GMP-specific phosphodiesterase class I)